MKLVEVTIIGCLPPLDCPPLPPLKTTVVERHHLKNVRVVRLCPVRLVARMFMNRALVFANPAAVVTELSTQVPWWACTERGWASLLTAPSFTRSLTSTLTRSQFTMPGSWARRFGRAHHVQSPTWALGLGTRRTFSAEVLWALGLAMVVVVVAVVVSGQ